MHRLITLRFSHYNEKARWALDRFAVPYEEEGYLPFFCSMAVAVATRGKGGEADRTSSRYSTQYALRQRERMTERAFGALPASGIDRNDAGASGWRASTSPRRHLHARAPRFGRDTSYLAVIDAAGNSVSMTPSDFPQSPMVPGMGLTLGIRMTQFRLDPESPTALEPGKRPRVTPHALMLLRDGTHVMSIGTPGAEMQTQANVQVLLNHLVFGMGIQRAMTPRGFDA